MFMEGEEPDVRVSDADKDWFMSLVGSGVGDEENWKNSIGISRRIYRKLPVFLVLPV
jgi:hypothetical protein